MWRGFGRGNVGFLCGLKRVILFCGCFYLFKLLFWLVKWLWDGLIGIVRRYCFFYVYISIFDLYIYIKKI